MLFGLILIQFLPLLILKNSLLQKFFYLPLLIVFTSFIMKSLNPIVSIFTQKHNFLIIFLLSILIEVTLVFSNKLIIQKTLDGNFVDRKLLYSTIFSSFCIVIFWFKIIDVQKLLSFGDVNSHILILNSLSSVSQPFLKLATVDSLTGEVNYDGYYYPDLFHHIGALLIQSQVSDSIQTFKYLNIFIHAFLFPVIVSIIIKSKFDPQSSRIYLFLIYSINFFPLALLSTGNFNSVGSFLLSIFFALMLSETKSKKLFLILLSSSVLFFAHPSYIVSLILFYLLFTAMSLQKRSHPFVYRYKFIELVRYFSVIAIIIFLLTFVTNLKGLLFSYLNSLPLGTTLWQLNNYDFNYLITLIYTNFFSFSNNLLTIPFGIISIVYVIYNFNSLPFRFILSLITLIYLTSFFSGFNVPVSLLSILSFPFYGSPLRVFPLFLFSVFFATFYIYDFKDYRYKSKINVVLNFFFPIYFFLANYTFFLSI